MSEKISSADLFCRCFKMKGNDVVGKDCSGLGGVGIDIDASCKNLTRSGPFDARVVGNDCSVKGDKENFDMKSLTLRSFAEC